jgi:hypothetical protein
VKWYAKAVIEIHLFWHLLKKMVEKSFFKIINAFCGIGQVLWGCGLNVAQKLLTPCWQAVQTMPFRGSAWAANALGCWQCYDHNGLGWPWVGLGFALVAMGLCP